MTSLGVGPLIYLGVMPLVKTFLTIIFGYLLARFDLFPAAASRGASQVTMNLALPALIFANIVPAFTPSNVSAIGPLLLLAFIYQGIGFAIGYILREICYVPRNFYQGLVVMCGTSNWGNLPTAVVLSVTQAAPFNPATDPALGVSFVSLFIVAYNLVFWVFGAAHSISWDYLPNIPQDEEAEQKVSWREKPIGGWIARKFLGYQKAPEQNACSSLSRKSGPDLEAVDNIPEGLRHSSKIELPLETPLERQISHHSIPSIHSRHIATRTHNTTAVATPTSRLSLEAPENATYSQPITKDDSSKLEVIAIPPTPPSIFRRTFSLLRVFLTPVTLSLIVSLPIALVKPLKALFVDATDAGGPNWHGPDGRPPLFFFIDTAQFIGNITVPMALLLLGASFARLKVPRPISRLPLKAMVIVALVKMVLMPVIGVLIVQAMVESGFIPRENKVERFVAMFLSGTPAAVNQLIVTQLYSVDGTADTLSAFLLVQYVFMFFGSAALTAISLSFL